MQKRDEMVSHRTGIVEFKFKLRDAGAGRVRLRVTCAHRGTDPIARIRRVSSQYLRA
jgi:hypothetical protein